ncbi:hypothetical protein ACMYSK_01420 [Klebsiella sp. I138]|uniref:hypothetical protein n=1 Tax=Klebsiella sp. I138 TaxID=2755385 RepID=UPI003DA9442A
MKRLKIISVSLMLMTLAGCATNMSERAAHVQVISQEQAQQYKFVSNITGSSTLTGVARHTGYQNAMNEVLDKAAEKGAQYVVIDPGSAPSYWATSEIIRATAYKDK